MKGLRPQWKLSQHYHDSDGYAHEDEVFRAEDEDDEDDDEVANYDVIYSYLINITLGKERRAYDNI